MKKLSNISPSLLLILPLFLIMLTVLVFNNGSHTENTMASQKKSASAAYIQVSVPVLK